MANSDDNSPAWERLMERQQKLLQKYRADVIDECVQTIERRADLDNLNGNAGDPQQVTRIVDAVQALKIAAPA